MNTDETKTKLTFAHSIPEFNLKVASFVSLMLLFSFQLYGQERIPYLSHGKYGYADPQGQVRIAPVYDEVKFFDRFDVAAVRQDTQWFLINTEGVQLVTLETKSYGVNQALSANNQALSAHGPLQYGSRENIDTIPHLLRQEFGSRGRRYIHSLTGKISPLFPDFNRYYATIGMLSGLEGILRHGLYIGRTGENKYEVMNSEAEIIVTSSVPPLLLNDSLISYMKDDISVILNFKTNTSFTLPYYTTSACISGTDFIVSNIHESWDHWNRSQLSLQKGVVDRNGTVIIQPQYDDLKLFAEKNLLAKKGDFSFFITPEGNRVDSNLYRSVYSDIEDTYYRAQLRNLKLIFLDSMGDRALNREFDKIEFNQNCQCYYVTSDSVASILTANLTNEISYKAEAIYRSDKSGYYVFMIEEKYGLIDQSGREIMPPIYEWCTLDGNSDFVIIQQNKLKGLMSLSGNLLMEPQFEDIHIEMFRDQPYLSVKQNGLYAYFDAHLNQLSDFQPNQEYLYEEKAPINWERDENDSYSLYNRFGQPLGFSGISFDEGYVLSDSNYLMLVHKNDSSFLLYEKQDKITIDTFQSADARCYSIEAGLEGVKERDLEGVRHFQGQWIVPLADHRILFISQYLIVCQKDDQYWFYDVKGKKINTITYAKLEIEPYMSVWRFEHKKKVGFISSYTGKTIVPPKYDEGFFHSYSCIEVNGIRKSGTNITLTFDTLGNKLLKTRFEDLYPIDLRDTVYYYVSMKKDKYGLIDAHGQECIPTAYKRVYPYLDTTFFVGYMEDHRRYIFNTDWQVAFADSTLPTGHESVELPNHRYLFYYKDFSLILDHMGRTLKRIDSTEVNEDGRKFQNYHFLEVTENGEVYLINKDSLISFREEPQR